MIVHAETGCVFCQLAEQSNAGVRGARDRHSTQEAFQGRSIFETGVWPSGLPHIGTFGEVARTTMVRLCVPRSHR